MPSLPLTLKAVAKVNLFLHINHRRADGYHELQTLFQLLDYGDDLSFSRPTRKTPDHYAELSKSLDGVPDNSNLIIKAANLLIQHAEQQGKQASLYPVRISVEKRLPMGGGVGGGSSNAATTLLALNHLWNLQLSCQQLARLGKSLGADVPVFVTGQSAYAEGIGEKLRPINLPEYWFVVITPDCQISTATVFSHKELTRDTPKSRIMPALEGDLQQLILGQAKATNDCESLVSQLYPEIHEAILWLDHHSKSQHAKARLSGTGASVFTCFTQQAEAQQVINQLPANYRGFVARGINQSPVINLLQTLQAAR